MLCKPIYEFLVWDNCNNNCKFCFQRSKPRLFDHEHQKLILNRTLEYINSDDFISGSHVLIVGGELFDDPKRIDFLLDFFQNIIELMRSGRIDLLYLNTNLIYKEQCFANLIRILNLFNFYNLFERLRFTTSFDLEGRFRRSSSKDMFFRNIRNLKDNFDKIHIVTNMILTKKFCEDVCNDSFNIFSFMKNNNCEINMIPYIILDNNLSASRTEIFKTIRHLYEQDSNFIKNWIINIDLKQPRRMFYYKDGDFISCECKNSDCGHSKNFKRYSSSESCFVCDIKEVFNDCI